MKQSLKVKYEERLRVLKAEFEGKFRRNEQTWRHRIDGYRQIVTREQTRGQELEGIIEK